MALYRNVFEFPSSVFLVWASCLYVSGGHRDHLTSALALIELVIVNGGMCVRIYICIHIQPYTHTYMWVVEGACDVSRLRLHRL